MVNKYKLSFRLLSEKSEILIVIEGQSFALDYFLQFCGIFGCSVENQSIKFQHVYKRTHEMIKKIDLILKDNNTKKLYPLRKFLIDIEPGKHFLFMPEKELSDSEKLILQLDLKIMDGTSIENEKLKLVRKDVIALTNIYELNIIHPQEHLSSLGERVKSKRKCIYCGQTEAMGATFHQKAHAISEALGNKHVIQNEECDACNNYFGKNIEPCFANNLSAFRVIYGVSGSNGVPHYKLKNKGNLERQGEATVIQVCSENINTQSTLESLKLCFGPKINPLNIYKSLVKFAYGVLPPKYRCDLIRTVKWLRYGESFGKLPQIRTLLNNKMFQSEPIITNYIRKDNNYELPFIVSEFKFLMLTFITIIPYSVKDNNLFINDNDLDKFIDLLPHIKSLKSNIRLRDYSRDAFVNYELNLNFKQVEK